MNPATWNLADWVNAACVAFGLLSLLAVVYPPRLRIDIGRNSYMRGFIYRRGSWRLTTRYIIIERETF